MKFFKKTFSFYVTKWKVKLIKVARHRLQFLSILMNNKKPIMLKSNNINIYTIIRTSEQLHIDYSLVLSK